MARLIIPADFSGTKTLTEDINKKHIADGAKSPLIQYMTEQQFTIADDVKNMNTAENSFTAAGLLGRQKENYRELRDNSFNSVFKNLQDEVQFLKKLYRGNVQQLGDWGITVNAKNRIDYPADFIGRTKVFLEFAKKFADYPSGGSPLQAFLDENKIDPATDAAAVTTALGYHTKFEEMGRAAEEQTNLTQLLVLPVQDHNRGIGQFLMGLYPKNPKKAGDWGFVVDSSKQAPKLRKTRVKPADKITVTGVVIGGSLTNTGKSALHVYRGKTTAGTPIVVEAGAMLGMTKGSSVITVVDPSTLITGEFTVLTY